MDRATVPSTQGNDAVHSYVRKAGLVRYGVVCCVVWQSIKEHRD